MAEMQTLQDDTVRSLHFRSRLAAGAFFQCAVSLKRMPVRNHDQKCIIPVHHASAYNRVDRPISPPPKYAEINRFAAVV
jgi:hypothetical protein